MISANEAREKLVETQKENDKEVLKDIEKAIYIAINDCKDHIHWSGHLRKSTREYLESLGYEIRIVSQCNEYCFIIKW